MANDPEQLAAWRRAPDRNIELALTRDRAEFGPEVLAIIQQVAEERGFVAGRPRSLTPIELRGSRRARLDPLQKWAALVAAAGVSAVVWCSEARYLAEHPDAESGDTPPTPCACVVLVLGAVSLYLFRRDAQANADRD